MNSKKKLYTMIRLINYNFLKFNLYMSDTKNIKKPCNQLGIRSYKYYDDNGKIIFLFVFQNTNGFSTNLMNYQWLPNIKKY